MVKQGQERRARNLVEQTGLPGGGGRLEKRPVLNDRRGETGGHGVGTVKRTMLQTPKTISGQASGRRKQGFQNFKMKYFNIKLSH